MEITTTETIANTVWGTGTGEGNTWVTGGIVPYPPAYDIVELRKHAIQVILDKGYVFDSLGISPLDDALTGAPTQAQTDAFLHTVFTVADVLVEYYKTGAKPEIIADIAT
jgi:propanediol dehydratase large subunit